VAGRYIARCGSDVKAGTMVLQKGTRLRAAQLAVAASVGAAKVRVFAKPRAAVLATGDELVAVDQTPGKAEIRNSSNIMLTALLRRIGCDVVDLGQVKDDPNLIREAILTGMKRADVMLVTGGMSMGEYDYVPRVLGELGMELKITKLRIKPGKPFVFATGDVGDRFFVFGLPGNPVSAFVCALRLASRLLLRLGGTPVQESWLEGRLNDALPPNGPREFYQPAVVKDGKVTVLRWKGSADLYTLAKANALLVRAENEPARQAGEVVKLLEVPT
jgi:molybdopterin molybdotransferase